MSDDPPRPKLIVKGFRAQNIGKDGIHIEGNPDVDISFSGVELDNVKGSAFRRSAGAVSTVEDYKYSLAEMAAQTILALGQKTAAIYGEAARTGNLGNSRLVFPLIDALEASWRDLVDYALDLLGRFASHTNIPRGELLAATEGELTRALDPLKYHSRIEPREGAWEKRPPGGQTVARMDALLPFMHQKLREFEIGTHPSAITVRLPWWRRVGIWLLDIWQQIAVTVIAGALLFLIFGIS